ncbi:phosphoenolpyruvate--protein phosphotransferase [Cellvibrio japonicus]|uniref:phosphoenolpyruvate--protein phosphotransferase n=1 Tax=Cellvibrio japonicus (strain Ueda107) TaxID=498211 RepID=B3PIV5_CELJU|nr:phosphoenolpyruvate--protein phosphotransferase [Cellvibrio japonicus]ACE83640.1 phosphoenolpyruvate-protein phosphotransferase PtsP [Cellvibrio japonicus Ueda107]QEI11165.1 phosphoenolpyruvate--protein phosphotransferase [Cellvibrio japonicus]QEI14739.1 phosphoenolpyruvate--protein phosphotransferase [Cellvibrio japonicus]QEI18319.1 phosphoenolpyruvate--protein phosphotransferase [Cellvibrio japonicus]
MLNSLRSIVQEVNAARDMKSALVIIVTRVKQAMKTQVCSVYLRDAQGDYVLMATDGLNASAVGQVRLAAGEGLVGRVVVREEPINLEHAEAHPSYQYFPETGEERYSSFLGVPIIHHRKVLGVLVVQQIEQRRFDEGEEAFLVTMSAQLAGVIAHAEATGVVVAPGEKATQAKFAGVSGAPGVAVGQAVIISPLADLRSVPYQACKDVDEELAFFHRSLAAVREDIKSLGSQLKSRINREEQALFDAYLAMLDDASLGGEVSERIRKGAVAAYAWSEVILEHESIFNSMSDPYLRERAADLRDLGRRVLAYLQESNQKTRIYPDKTVLIGEELTASMLGEVPKEKLVGLVSVLGSSNSHVAILARAMDIPTVMGAVDLPFTQLEGRQVIVDGYKGNVYSDPSDNLLKQYEAIELEEQAIVKGLEALKDLPCETLDHYRLPLFVNTGLMADVVRSLERGAEGVGLYRTEVPFLLRDRFPSEEEQRAIYREQLGAFAPHMVTMRTLDIGGDKALPYFPIEEDNPFLGWRGIRVTLDHPEIFLSQIRAMIKASEGLDNLRILLPMITNVHEVDASKALIHRVYSELVEEGYSVKVPQIGAMVEVPAAVYQARELSKKVDFLSVGSNDLTQYLLAVDRNNVQVAGLYQAYHPAVLQALQHVVDAGHAEQVSVSICGELAGDPGAAILLMAMGYDVLSMSATNLPKVKSVIRNITLVQAKELLAEVMQMAYAEQIQARVNRALREAGVTRLMRTAVTDEAS